MRFKQLTWENDVIFFTGLHGTEIFKSLYDYFVENASVMTYWDGSKKTLGARKGPSSVELAEDLLTSPPYDLEQSLVPINKSGPR